MRVSKQELLQDLQEISKKLREVASIAFQFHEKTKSDPEVEKYFSAYTLVVNMGKAHSSVTYLQQSIRNHYEGYLKREE